MLPIIQTIVRFSPVLLVPVAAVCGFVVFASEVWLERFAMIGWRTDSLREFGLGFLMSVSLLVTYAGKGIWDGWQLRQRVKRRLRGMREYMHSLSQEQKQWLRGYRMGEVATQACSLTYGPVNDLRRKGILYYPAGVGDWINGIEVAIQPWALEYLRTHPELLDD